LGDLGLLVVELIESGWLGFAAQGEQHLCCRKMFGSLITTVAVRPSWLTCTE
jgi:hypothetical protein